MTILPIAHALKAILETMIIQITEFKIYERDVHTFELRGGAVHFYAEAIVPSYMTSAGLDIELALAQATDLVQPVVTLPGGGRLEYYVKVIGGGKYGKFLFTLPAPPRPVVAYLSDGELGRKRLDYQHVLNEQAVNPDTPCLIPCFSHLEALTQLWRQDRVIKSAVDALDWAGFTEGDFCDRLNAIIAAVKPNAKEAKLPAYMDSTVHFAPGSRPRC